jgi:hypothetical protein
LRPVRGGGPTRRDDAAFHVTHLPGDTGTKPKLDTGIKRNGDTWNKLKQDTGQKKGG